MTMVSALFGTLGIALLSFLSAYLSNPLDPVTLAILTIGGCYTCALLACGVQVFYATRHIADYTGEGNDEEELAILPLQSSSYTQAQTQYEQNPVPPSPEASPDIEEDADEHTSDDDYSDVDLSSRSHSTKFENPSSSPPL